MPIKDYEKMVEELEDMENVRLYDEAKKEDDGKRILLSEYLKKRKAKLSKPVKFSSSGLF